MSDVRSPQLAGGRAGGGAGGVAAPGGSQPVAAVSMPLSSDESPLLETALARSFELVAGIVLFALVGTALIVVLVPASTAGRVAFAVELVVVGVAAVFLALLLSRRSARAVTQPLESLESTVEAIASGDLGARVHFHQAAAEIRAVGESVNSMARELERLHAVEVAKTEEERVRRQLAEMVHASLARADVVEHAVELVGRVLGADRLHIRLLERGHGNVIAEWRRDDDVVSLRDHAPDDTPAALVALTGITDDNTPLAIDDVHGDDRVDEQARSAFDALRTRAALKMPLDLGPEMAGVLVASRQAAHVWTATEVALAEAFATEIGRALDHMLMFELQNQLVERLGLLDRSKNDFLAEVSGELRGPLSRLIGYAEVLRDDRSVPVDEERRRMLDVIERDGRQVLVLIDDLLTMSRIEAGMFTPAVASVDVEEVVRRVCDAVAPGVGRGGLALEASVAPGFVMTGDEQQIERAVMDLVANAVKFTPAGGRIDVLARTIGDDVVLAVRDTGIGIAEEDHGDLFTRFFASRAVPRRATLGTGLGLYIVKQIVDGHGGHVTVESEPGRGSTFTMYFPGAVVRDPVRSERAADGSDSAPSSPDGEVG